MTGDKDSPDVMRMLGQPTRCEEGAGFPMSCAATGLESRVLKDKPPHVRRRFVPLGLCIWQADVVGFAPAPRSSGEGDCAVPVLYLILRFLADLAGSGGSDQA